MQLLVYALAVKDIYGTGPLKVGNWFLRSNEKVFFEPEKQGIEAIRTEITEMAAKIKAAAFEPKKGSWECAQCDYKCLCDS
jgi:guanylate kinase